MGKLPHSPNKFRFGDRRMRLKSPVAFVAGDVYFSLFQLSGVLMNRSALGRSFFAIAAALSLLGCNNSGLTEVTGKVTFNDEPVTSGTISFVAADKPTAYGDIQSDGSYTLKTVKPGDGATPGSYQVTVVAVQDQGNALPEDRTPLPPPTVPIKYTSLATTDLTADVEGGKENVIDFNLTGKLGK